MRSSLPLALSLLLTITLIIGVNTETTCTSNCTECEAPEDGGKCLTCRKNYGRVTGRICNHCEQPGCLSCDWDLESCSVCLPGFFLVLDNGPVIDEYEIDRCDSCSVGCKKCESSNECQECKLFYSLKNSKDCSIQFLLISLLLIPTLVCGLMAYCYPDNWKTIVLEKNV